MGNFMSIQTQEKKPIILSTDQIDQLDISPKPTAQKALRIITLMFKKDSDLYNNEIIKRYRKIEECREAYIEFTHDHNYEKLQTKERAIHSLEKIHDFWKKSHSKCESANGCQNCQQCH